MRFVKWRESIWIWREDFGHKYEKYSTRLGIIYVLGLTRIDFSLNPSSWKVSWITSRFKKLTQIIDICWLCQLEGYSWLSFIVEEDGEDQYEVKLLDTNIKSHIFWYHFSIWGLHEFIFFSNTSRWKFSWIAFRFK